MVRILDLPHAAEHITLFGQIATPEGPLARPTECARLRHALKHDGPAGVLAELRAVVAAHPDLPEAAKPVAYLEKRQTPLQYPQFVADGWPIGSGMGERANKLEVEDRLKGAGMHWAEANVNPVLALRNALCNDRWDETWMVIARAQRRRQVVLRCQERRARRTVVPAPAAVRRRTPVAVPAAAAAPALGEAVAKPRHPWTFAWSIRRQGALADAGERETLRHTLHLRHICTSPQPLLH